MVHEVFMRKKKGSKHIKDLYKMEQKNIATTHEEYSKNETSNRIGNNLNIGNS